VFTVEVRRWLLAVPPREVAAVVGCCERVVYDWLDFVVQPQRRFREAIRAGARAHRASTSRRSRGSPVRGSSDRGLGASATAASHDENSSASAERT
jgi:hypothetical protein